MDAVIVNDTEKEIAAFTREMRGWADYGLALDRETFAQAVTSVHDALRRRNKTPAETIEEAVCAAISEMQEGLRKGSETMDKNAIQTIFHVSMDFERLDEKMRRFIALRNELAMLAEEIGIEVKDGILFVDKK